MEIYLREEVLYYGTFQNGHGERRIKESKPEE